MRDIFLHFQKLNLLKSIFIDFWQKKKLKPTFQHEERHWRLFFTSNKTRNRSSTTPYYIQGVPKIQKRNKKYFLYNFFLLYFRIFRTPFTCLWKVIVKYADQIKGKRNFQKVRTKRKNETKRNPKICHTIIPEKITLIFSNIDVFKWYR